jgi:hypothetical protein
MQSNANNIETNNEQESQIDIDINIENDEDSNVNNHEYVYNSDETEEEQKLEEEKENSRFKDGEKLNMIRVRFPGNARSFPFLIGKRRFAYGQKVVAMSDRGMSVGYKLISL